MKKITTLVFLLIITMLIPACGIRGKEVLYIEFCEWKMQAVMSNDTELADNDDLVVAVGESDELYPNAKVVDLILTASGGEITLVDATNNRTYTGSYKTTEETSKEISYEIIIDGITGNAILSITEHYGENQIPTLPINMGEYSIYFLPNEADVK